MSETESSLTPEEFARWEERTLARARSRSPERRERFVTSSDIEYKTVFTELDTADIDPLDDIGFPGEYPFTRGVQPTMYRGRLWTMRMYAGFGTAEESNARYRYLLQSGGTGLSCAFDLPTQMGYDSDSDLANGEVGRTGVAIDSIEDMRTLMREIPLDKVSTSMTINATASTLLALYIAVADERGIGRDAIRGTIQNDVLKEYIARGTYIYPPQQSMRIITDIFDFCADEVPRWNTVSISGYHIREAGSTAVQEVAFTLADGIAYVQAAIDKGLDVDRFAGRLSFFFNAHNDFLEEIAKFRAARRLWARIMKERFGAQDPRSWKLRFHTQTGGSTLTAQQPKNNIVRVTLQALAAVLGGTQSLHTNGLDEALALPTEETALIALRTQQIIAEESGVTNTIDPLGGSWAIESLTSEIEQRAKEYIQKIDDIGGMIRAIESGFPQKEIHEAAFRYQRAIEKGQQTIVGVNKYRHETESIPEVLRVDPALEGKQVARLRVFKQNRDATVHADMLQTLENAARGSDNLMPILVDAVKVGVTLGEIADCFRGVFGQFQEVKIL